MITMEDWTTIRNLKQKNPKLGTRAIARLAGVSRNTVKRALTSQEPPEYTREGKINPDIEPFAKYIEVKIVGLHLKGSRVLEDIKSKGYIGSKSAFYRFMEKIRVKQQRTFKRYETKPGEQAQYDWSPYTVRLGEYITRVSVFCYILGYSRYRIYEASLSETQGSILEALEMGIRKTGGVPERIQTDNARCFVDNASVDNFKWNKRYLHFCGHYRLTPTRSLPRRPWSKGKVENPFDYLEDHFIEDNEFLNFEDFLRKLKVFEQTVNSKEHGTTKRLPVELFALERQYLKDLPENNFVGLDEDHRNVTSDCLICFKSNRYSVPHIFAGKEVWIKVSRGYLLEIYSSKGVLAAVHNISLAKGQVIMDPVHYKNYNSERGNWERLAKEFKQTYPGYEWFLDKLKTQKRINPNYHLTQIVSLSQFYSKQDMIKAFDESVVYNMYSHTIIKAFLEKNAKVMIESVEVSNSRNIINSDIDIKRPIDQYKLFN